MTKNVGTENENLFGQLRISSMIHGSQSSIKDFELSLSVLHETAVANFDFKLRCRCF